MQESKEQPDSTQRPAHIVQPGDNIRCIGHNGTIAVGDICYHATEKEARSLVLGRADVGESDFFICKECSASRWDGFNGEAEADAECLVWNAETYVQEFNSDAESLPLLVSAAEIHAVTMYNYLNTLSQSIKNAEDCYLSAAELYASAGEMANAASCMADAAKFLYDAKPSTESSSPSAEVQSAMHFMKNSVVDCALMPTIFRAFALSAVYREKAGQVETPVAASACINALECLSKISPPILSDERNVELLVETVRIALKNSLASDNKASALNAALVQVRETFAWQYDAGSELKRVLRDGPAYPEPKLHSKVAKLFELLGDDARAASYYVQAAQGFLSNGKDLLMQAEGIAPYTSRSPDAVFAARAAFANALDLWNGKAKKHVNAEALHSSEDLLEECDRRIAKIGIGMAVRDTTHVVK